MLLSAVIGCGSGHGQYVLFFLGNICYMHKTSLTNIVVYAPIFVVL